MNGLNYNDILDFVHLWLYVMKRVITGYKSYHSFANKA